MDVQTVHVAKCLLRNPTTEAENKLNLPPSPRQY